MFTHVSERINPFPTKHLYNFQFHNPLMNADNLDLYDLKISP